MAAILDAILDFSARTNFRQCIPLVSQTTDYKVHFGICHVLLYFYEHPTFILAPGRVAQSVGHLTRKSGVLGSIPGLATYFRFSFRFFKKGSCQLLAKVCA